MNMSSSHFQDHHDQLQQQQQLLPWPPLPLAAPPTLLHSDIAIDHHHHDCSHELHRQLQPLFLLNGCDHHHQQQQQQQMMMMMIADGDDGVVADLGSVRESQLLSLMMAQELGFNPDPAGSFLTHESAKIKEEELLISAAAAAELQAGAVVLPTVNISRPSSAPAGLRAAEALQLEQVLMAAKQQQQWPAKGVVDVVPGSYLQSTLYGELPLISRGAGGPPYMPLPAIVEDAAAASASAAAIAAAASALHGGPSINHYKMPSLVSGVSQPRKIAQVLPKRAGQYELRSSMPSSKVRKEKLGDRIAALQQLVSPFGKTDTASVLMEAIGYIKFLQEQVEALSVPFMRSPGNKKQRTQYNQVDDEKEMKAKLDLKSRGLCLVPLSYTSFVTSEINASVWPLPN